MANFDPYPDRTIRSDDRISDNIIVTVYKVLHEIWRYRSNISVIYREQFRNLSNGTAFGIFWNYALPLVPLTVYWFLSNLRVFPNFEGVDPATYITFGVTLWFLFTGLVQAPIHVVASSTKTSMKSSFPLSATLVCGYANLFFETFVRFAVVTLIVFIGSENLNPHAILLPILLIPAFMFFVGAGIFLAAANLIYRDVSRIVTICLQYGIFISGVIFPYTNVEILILINVVNPLAIFIAAARDLVFGVPFSDPSPYIILSAISIFLFVAALRLFYVSEYRIRGID